MHPWKISRALTGKCRSSIIPRTTLTIKRQDKSLLKSTRHITPCPLRSREKHTMTCYSAKSNQSEHTISSMTFSVVGYSKFLKKTSSSNLSSTDHGEREWTKWWIYKRIWVLYKMENLWKLPQSIPKRME